jgi:hypothetical protein
MANPELPQRINTMKHLLNGVAVAAALVIAAPVWAQNPSGGNAVGTPGPNPGGPGLTPYSTGAPPPAATAPPPGASTSATPPMHRHPHAMHHPMHARAMHKAPSLAGDTTAQLNGEELARIQAGNFSNPPPAAPMPEGPGSPKSLPGPKSH